MFAAFAAMIPRLMFAALAAMIPRLMFAAFTTNNLPSHLKHRRAVRIRRFHFGPRARRRQRPQRAKLAAIRRKDQARSHPRGSAGLNVALAVPDHPRRCGGCIEAREQRFQHSRFRFAALAAHDERSVASGPALRMVHAHLHPCDTDALLFQELDESGVRSLDRARRDLPLRRAGLVRGHGKDESGFRQDAHPFDRARQKTNLVGMERDHDRAGFFVADDVDERCVAIEDRDPRHRTLSHFVAFF
jgi:hypothetical protein